MYVRERGNPLIITMNNVIKQLLLSKKAPSKKMIAISGFQCMHV